MTGDGHKRLTLLIWIGVTLRSSEKVWTDFFKISIEEVRMRHLRIAVWLMFYIGITVIFNICFRMYYTPAGLMGEVTKANMVASTVYILFWVILSVIAGLKRYRSVLTASIIYSSLPFISLIGILFSGTRLAVIILIVFYWGVPVQGLHQALVYLQLPLFLLGYKFGSGMDKVFSCRNKDRNV